MLQEDDILSIAIRSTAARREPKKAVARLFHSFDYLSLWQVFRGEILKPKFQLSLMTSGSIVRMTAMGLICRAADEVAAGRLLMPGRSLRGDSGSL